MDEISKALGEMTAEMRNVNARLDRLDTTVAGQAKEIEGRVRRLELWRSFLAGGGAIVAAGVAWLFGK